MHEQASFINGKFIFSVGGVCCICRTAVEFRAERDDEISPKWYKHWFRGSLKCRQCGSLPRERALFNAVELFYPNWKDLRIHESSPVYRGASRRFQDECPGYVKSQFDPALPQGSIHPVKKYRSEDLEHQTFTDSSFDLVITQDVFEHLFAPELAIAEIARTLESGGAHIMTVPLVNGVEPSARRARLENGVVEYLQPAQYHGNPMSHDGSLVTMDWGYDIIDFLSYHSGTSVSLIQVENLYVGLYAVYNDVLVCRKLRSVRSSEEPSLGQSSVDTASLLRAISEEPTA
jgi:hypothetical protein